MEQALIQETKEMNLNIKIQLFHETDPFIYIQHDLNSKRYRISTNYEFLNNEYNLKIQFIRDFNNIKKIISNKYNKHHKNNIFDIFDYKDNSSIFFKNNINIEELEFKFLNHINGIGNKVGAENTKNINNDENNKNNEKIERNNFKIYKYISGKKENKNRTCIIIFNKIYNNESNYSLFFVSEEYLNLEDYMYHVL